MFFEQCACLVCSKIGRAKIECCLFFVMQFTNEKKIEFLLLFSQKLGVMLLRYFNPVGAHPSGRIGEDPQGVPNNLMPYISQVAVGRRPKLMVYGNDYDTPDGTGVRDYIHIMDLAEGHTAAVSKILKPEFKGVSAYNLGTGSGVSVLEMVKAFEKASGVTIPIEFAPRRPGDIPCAYATAAVACEELGWKTKYTLDEMCKYLLKLALFPS